MHPTRETTHNHTHTHTQCSGVQRLQQQAGAIGDEASVQNALLEAFNENVDTSADALREEAKHAEVVRKTTRMFNLQVCLACEAVILVILLIMYFSHGG